MHPELRTKLSGLLIALTTLALVGYILTRSNALSYRSVETKLDCAGIACSQMLSYPRSRIGRQDLIETGPRGR